MLKKLYQIRCMATFVQKLERGNEGPIKALEKEMLAINGQ